MDGDCRSGGGRCERAANARGRAGRLHNITYVARVDGVAPGSQATFVTSDNQTSMAS